MKKYYYILIVCFGILASPLLSRAATYNTPYNPTSQVNANQQNFYVGIPNSSQSQSISYYGFLSYDGSNIPTSTGGQAIAELPLTSGSCTSTNPQSSGYTGFYSPTFIESSTVSGGYGNGVVYIYSISGNSVLTPYATWNGWRSDQCYLQDNDGTSFDNRYTNGSSTHWSNWYGSPQDFPDEFLIMGDNTASSVINWFGTGSTTLSFAYPSNGANISDFSSWGLNYANTQLGHTYNGVVTYSQAASSLSYQDSNSFSSSTSGIDYITKTQPLSLSNATTVWEAYADLYDTTGGGNVLVATSTAITFNISPSSIQFTFPTYGTSTGLFNPWLLSDNGLNSNSYYSVTVLWQACPINNPVNSSQCSATLVSTSPTVLGSIASSSGFSVSRTEFNSDYANNVTIYATGELGQWIYPLNPLHPGATIIASTTIEFTLLSIPNSSPSSSLPNGGYYINVSSTGNGTYSQSTTTGNNAILTTATSTFAQWCPQNTSIIDPASDISWAMCEAVNYAFNPNVIPVANTWFQGQISGIEGVPPFSGFFDITSSTLNGLGQFNQATSTGVSIGIEGYPTQQQVTIVTINSSTYFSGFAGSSSTNASSSQATGNYLEVYIGAWLWIAAGIKILFIFTTKS